MTTTQTTDTEAPAAAAPADMRRTWRRILAFVAPVPGIALAVSNGITPADLGGSTADEFASFAAHPVAGGWTIAFSGLFALTLAPAAAALMMAYRRHAPRLTTYLVGFVAVGFLFSPLYPSTNLLAAITGNEGLDRDAGIALAEGVTDNPWVGLAVIPFFLTITLGRIALGVMLWRVRLAPRWMAVAMLLATPVEFVLNPAIGNTGPAIAYLLTAVGFLSASYVLLRTPDDEFDLPPVAR